MGKILRAERVKGSSTKFIASVNAAINLHAPEQEI